MSELHRDGHGEKRNGKRPLRLEKARLALRSKWSVQIKDRSADMFKEAYVYRRRSAGADQWNFAGTVGGLSPEAARELKADLESIPEPEGSEEPNSKNQEPRGA